MNYTGTIMNELISTRRLNFHEFQKDEFRHYKLNLRKSMKIMLLKVLLIPLPGPEKMELNAQS